jgi:hypothetical protein
MFEVPSMPSPLAQPIDFNRIEHFASLVSRLVNAARSHHKTVVAQTLQALRQQLRAWAPAAQTAAASASADVPASPDDTLAAILFDNLTTGFKLTKTDTKECGPSENDIKELIIDENDGPLADHLINAWKQPECLTDFIIDIESATDDPSCPSDKDKHFCLLAIEQEYFRLQDFLAAHIKSINIQRCLTQLLKLGLLHAAVTLINAHWSIVTEKAHEGDSSFKAHQRIMHDALQAMIANYGSTYFIKTSDNNVQTDTHETTEATFAWQLLNLFGFKKARPTFYDLPLDVIILDREENKAATPPVDSVSDAPPNNELAKRAQLLVNAAIPDSKEEDDDDDKPAPPTMRLHTPIFDYLPLSDKISLFRVCDRINHLGTEHMAAFFAANGYYQPEPLALLKAMAAALTTLQDDYEAANRQTSTKRPWCWNLDVLFVILTLSVLLHQLFECIDTSCHIPSDQGFKKNVPLNANISNVSNCMGDIPAGDCLGNSYPFNFTVEIRNRGEQCFIFPPDPAKTCAPYRTIANSDCVALDGVEPCAVDFMIDEWKALFKSAVSALYYGYPPSRFICYFIAATLCWIKQPAHETQAVLHSRTEKLEKDISSFYECLRDAQETEQAPYLSLQDYRWNDWFRGVLLRLYHHAPIVITPPKKLTQLPANMQALEDAIRAASIECVVSMRASASYTKLARKYGIFSDADSESTLPLGGAPERYAEDDFDLDAASSDGSAGGASENGSGSDADGSAASAAISLNLMAPV